MMQAVRLHGVPLPLRWQVPPVGWSVDGDAALTITAGARTDLFVDPQGTAEALNAPRLLGWPGTVAEDISGDLPVDIPVDIPVDAREGDREVGDPGRAGRPDGGDFMLSARVRVGFSATYDAGVLLVWAHERSWAKLCFERSPQRGTAAAAAGSPPDRPAGVQARPQGEPMIVSVVTRGVSDDANGFVVDGDQVWLRVARLGPAFAFHASTDGSDWRLVRYFALGAEPGAGGGAPAVGFEAQSPTGAGCTATFDQIRFVRERLGDLRGGE